MEKYNGHRSWNAWNVSLWISNDEGLYFSVIDTFKTKLRKYEGNRAKALRFTVREMVSMLSGNKTPDGAKYNPLSVKLAVLGCCEGVEGE
jgi:hypothetical protein